MIHKKLSILKDSNVINEVAYEYTTKVISALEAEGFDISSDKTQVFITHLAMATNRQLKGEAMEPLAEIIQQDLEAQPTFSKAQALWKSLVAFAPIEFVEAEEGYIYIHMCSLLTK
ncbi:MAG: PRD domain-containing protein [Culicoidibacterales bacterium]